MAEPFPAPPSVIDRQTVDPKVEAWQVHDEGAIVSLNLDRPRAAEVLPSNCRSVSSNDPSNPTNGPDPWVGHRLERRSKCLRPPGKLLRPRRPEPAEGGRVRTPCGDTDVLLSLPNRYRFRFHSIEPPRLNGEGPFLGSRDRPTHG